LTAESAPVNGETPPETRGRTIGRFARFYDAAGSLVSFGQNAKTNREIVARAGVKPGERVLDAGCGTGAQTLPAAEVAGPRRVSGIDPSPQMLERARSKAAKNGLDIDFRAAAIEKLPYGDGEFDVVLSSRMLHHLPEDVMRSGFAEVRRVLKPGGRFLVTDIVAGRSLIGALIRLFGHAHSPQGLKRIKAMLGEAGFATVEELPLKQRHLFCLRAS
jgi:demethylmenaquinone methyltransferase/2-methoxy-6-polyprenyl-1,4-benzoquinol methylase/phosphoethanolamine N-methyltransferase